MACVQMKIHWGKKKARLEGREAGFELQQFLPSEAQGHQRQEPKGHSSKLSKIAGFLRVLRRNKGDKNVTDPPETSKGMDLAIFIYFLYLFLKIYLFIYGLGEGQRSRLPTEYGAPHVVLNPRISIPEIMT